MRFVHVIAAAVLSSTLAVPALAQSADIKRGAMVRASDGERLARIDRIVTDSSGAPVAVSLLYGGRFVQLPYESLSTADGKIVSTSLSRDDVRKIR